MSDVILRGITWNHARGYNPMVATAAAYARAHQGIEIIWEKRSLQAFADRPIAEMASAYDLMVIDHPHVGEVAGSGELLALDSVGRGPDLAELARKSVGGSHGSYKINGHQWALAIDAATPVAAYRPDRLKAAPDNWPEVVNMARQHQVAFALVPISTLMTFMGMANNLGFDLAREPGVFIRPEDGAQVLDLLREIVDLMDPKCLALDPIGILDWMSSDKSAPAYAPFGYGYTNYSRPGYCDFPLCFADAPGILSDDPGGTVLGGTGIAVSAKSGHLEIATDYAFWIAGATCQSGLFFDAGGQPGNAAAWESEHCNAASRNFFHNTRRTLEASWIRPRYAGYMEFQDRGGDIIHAFLRGETSARMALDELEISYRESRK